MVKNPPAVQETWVRSLGWEDPLEKGFQHSGLENSMDCIVHGVTKSRTWATFSYIYNICFSLSDLFHSVWQTLGSSTSLQMIQHGAFLWLSNIHLCYYLCIYMVAFSTGIMSHSLAQCQLQNRASQMLVKCHFSCSAPDSHSPFYPSFSVLSRYAFDYK